MTSSTPGSAGAAYRPSAGPAPTNPPDPGPKPTGPNRADPLARLVRDAGHHLALAAYAVDVQLGPLARPGDPDHDAEKARLSVGFHIEQASRDLNVLAALLGDMAALLGGTTTPRLTTPAGPLPTPGTATATPVAARESPGDTAVSGAGDSHRSDPDRTRRIGGKHRTERALPVPPRWPLPR